jgi:hypothetical protein
MDANTPERIKPMKHFCRLATTLFFLAAISTYAQTTARVVSGRTAPYTDSKGQVWQADTGFSGGATYGDSTLTIAGTADPAPFQNERWCCPTAPAPMTYTFSVANGAYTVNLYEAEIFYSSIGARIFNVKVNGTPVLTNFDIVAAAGGPNKAIVKSFAVLSS